VKTDLHLVAVAYKKSMCETSPRYRSVAAALPRPHNKASYTGAVPS